MANNFLIVVTRKEPCEAYIAQAWERDELYERLVKACHLTRRGQIFELKGITPTDSHFQTFDRLVKLSGVGDVYLNGEKEVILDRYINLTEEMEAQPALFELKRARERLTEEIEKVETELATPQEER